MRRENSKTITPKYGHVETAKIAGIDWIGDWEERGEDRPSAVSEGGVNGFDYDVSRQILTARLRRRF